MTLKSILIIDDSEADQFFARLTIEAFDKDIQLHQAYDGKEGLEVLECLEREPDIIFLDINMPIMNGLKFLEKYSRSEYTNSTIFILTSSDQQSDVKKSTAYDCVRRYMIKPLKELDLMDIAKILKKQKSPK